MKLVNAVGLIGVSGALAMGLAGCNRQASADANNTAGVPAVAAPPAAEPAAPAPAPAAAPSPPPGPLYAQVVSVQPIKSGGAPAHQVCRDEVVQQEAPPKDQHRIAGTAIGAVLGGVLGNQIGHGGGRTLATLAGAAAGGYGGNKVEQHYQRPQVTTATVRRCSMVAAVPAKTVAYQVSYLYNGVTKQVRMDHDPGSRVEIQQGVSVVGAQ
ncbi:glycine zipper 2TM domain-containing protein [Frateuria aurantia]